MLRNTLLFAAPRRRAAAPEIQLDFTGFRR
jgi:hypothetical protein